LVRRRAISEFGDSRHDSGHGKLVGVDPSPFLADQVIGRTTLSVSIKWRVKALSGFYPLGVLSLVLAPPVAHPGLQANHLLACHNPRTPQNDVCDPAALGVQ
jgi:hypothetical protein